MFSIRPLVSPSLKDAEVGNDRAFKNWIVAVVPSSWPWGAAWGYLDMRKSLWIILTVLLGTGAAIARADQITLDVSGSLVAVNSPGTCSVTGCTLGGDIVINNTTGAVISADITMSGESPSVGPFSTFGSVIPSVGLTRLALTDSSGNFIDLFFATPTVGSLVGYDGGALDPLTGVGVPPPAPPPTWLLTSGALTPVTTPEPSSLVFILAGIGLVFVMRKRIGHSRLQAT